MKLTLINFLSIFPFFMNFSFLKIFFPFQALFTTRSTFYCIFSKIEKKIGKNLILAVSPNSYVVGCSNFVRRCISMSSFQKCNKKENAFFRARGGTNKLVPPKNPRPSGRAKNFLIFEFARSKESARKKIFKKNSALHFFFE